MERHTLNEAADWFVRMQDQRVQSGTREKFANWLLLSPDHVAAYMRVSEIYGGFGAAFAKTQSKEELVKAARESKEESNVVALSMAGAGRINTSDEEAEARSGVRRRMKVFAAAASIFALTLFLGLMISRQWSRTHFSTGIGEQLSVPLEDGSLVYLNTNSALSVDLTDSERRIVLTRGEARFTVAKDMHRPFIVKTRHATVRALGTIFNVHTANERTAVSVIEGRIVVTGQADLASVTEHSPDEEDPSQIFLRTGQQVAVTSDGEIHRNAGPLLERVMGWPSGRLVFRDEPLADLVKDFNRYHKLPLRIADAELAGHRVNGTFDAYDRTSLLQFLERYEGVRVTPEADGGQLLSRAEASRKSAR